MSSKNDQSFHFFKFWFSQSSEYDKTQFSTRIHHITFLQATFQNSFLISIFCIFSFLCAKKCRSKKNFFLFLSSHFNKFLTLLGFSHLKVIETCLKLLLFLKVMKISLSIRLSVLHLIEYYISWFYTQAQRYIEAFVIGLVWKKVE